MNSAKEPKEPKYPKKVRLWAVRDNNPYLAQFYILDDVYAVELRRPRGKWYGDPASHLHKREALFPSQEVAARKLKGEVVWVIDDRERVVKGKASRDRNGHRTVYNLKGHAVSPYHVHETRAGAVKELRQMLRDSIKRSTKELRTYSRQLRAVK